MFPLCTLSVFLCPDCPGFPFLSLLYNTNIHDPGGIRTRNPRRRAAADPRLRPLDHWDRLDPETYRLVAQCLNDYPALYRTPRLFKCSAGHALPLCLARRIKSALAHFPIPFLIPSFLILSSHLGLGIPSCPLPSGFRPKIWCYASLTFSMHATCPSCTYCVISSP